MFQPAALNVISPPPVVKGGTHDDILTISRDENSNIVEKHGKSIPEELVEIYELAEVKKKKVLGK